MRILSPDKLCAFCKIPNSRTMEREPTYEELIKENAKLKARVAELEKYVNFNENKTTTENHPYISYFSNSSNTFDLNDLKSHSTLSKQQIERYSRQLLIPEIGVKGQLKLANSSVLIVGAGGLGAPTSLYLAAAGVGRIGIIDYDSVETSNLHRQVIHSEKSVGIPKAVSARDAVLRLNSSIECIAYDVEFNRTNAIPIIKSYDIVLDASDNMATRYLLNDACIMLNKVLVSGSALRTEGQVTVYNFKGGPCYRCLFPKPPPPESVTNCSEGGVLGVVTGIIGCIQALEAIKVITNSEPSSILAQKLLLFDAMSPRFQIVKLRGRNPKCEVCGDEPTIKELIDYVLFCQSGPHDKTPNKNILERAEHISPIDFRDLRAKGTEHLLVDVREEIQFDICSLPDSYHVPLAKLGECIEEVKQRAKYTEGQSHIPIYTVCRRGNDSQDAVKLLKSHGFTLVQNIEGGILKWNSDVDPSFPIY